jgi:PBP1b-binding outer membrane lipoprotein LpoB
MNKLMMLCAIAALIAGCSSSNQPQSAQTSPGRKETKSLEAASAAGYDGKAIRKGVDATLDKNDQHNQDLEKELKSGSEGQQKP